MIKPENCVPNVKDRLVISANVDFSATGAQSKGIFCDPLYDWEIISIEVRMTVAYIASQATNVKVGTIDDDDKFAASQSMGASAIAQGAAKAITQTSTKILSAGQLLTTSHVQASSQTGEGQFVIRLRPMHANYVSSKRPGGAAEATT
jgi:hypothetical protein